MFFVSDLGRSTKMTVHLKIHTAACLCFSDILGQRRNISLDLTYEAHNLALGAVITSVKGLTRPDQTTQTLLKVKIDTILH